MVESLWLQFPPPRNDIAASLVASSFLASQDMSKLQAASANTDDSALSALAWLRVEIEKMEKRQGDLQSKDVNEDDHFLTKEVKVENGSSRSLAKFHDGDVLVETKLVFTSRNSKILDVRIKNLARLLASGKPHQMRILNCLGIISNPENDRTIHKFIFQLPSSSIFTLSEVLKEQRKTLLLGQSLSLRRSSQEHCFICTWLAGYTKDSGVIASYFVPRIPPISIYPIRTLQDSNTADWKEIKRRMSLMTETLTCTVI